MGDVALIVVAAIVIVGLACLLVGLPVLALNRRQEQKQMVGMSDEERTTYLARRKGLRRLSVPSTATSLETPQTARSAPARRLQRVLVGVLTALIVAVLIWYLVGTSVEDRAAQNAIDQYDIAKRSGSAMDTCVHAGIVRATFLQAKNEAKYVEWKAVEQKDCSAAGLPFTP